MNIRQQLLSLRVKTLALSLILFSFTTVYASDDNAYRSKYIGQEKREIKSLSNDDISQLREGKGWGLAKAAELNGMPGPIHLLQMKDKIGLSISQEKQITELYKEMKNEAIPLGKRLIALEKRLNESFASREIDAISLGQQLEEIADVQKQLRFVHLSAHLKTPKVLDEHQIDLYNQLRGYGAADPCSHIPEGHDAAMWKKHNGCN